MQLQEFCEDNVREYGEIVLVTSTIAPDDLTMLVRKIAEQSGQRVGWHYHEDDVRMVVRCLGDRERVEAVILTLLPEHNDLFRAAQAERGVYYN